MAVPWLRLLEIPINVGRDDARREAHDELAKNKYGNQIPDGVARLLHWVQDQIQRLVEALFGHGAFALTGSGWPLVAFLVAVVLVVLGILVWRFGLPRMSPRVPDAVVGTDAEHDPEDYRSAAERAAAAGDYRTAVQEAFRALVRELELRTIVEPRASRTALETAALAATVLPSQAGALSEAAMTFNAIAYSRGPARAADYERVTAATTRVLEAAAAGYVGTDV